MRTVLLTSNSFRHQYIARCLAEATDLQLIITEEKSASISDTTELSEVDKIFMEEHFQKRAESELQFFGKNGFPTEVLQLKVPNKDVNSKLNFEILKDLNPDYIILFGTSIIKGDLLVAFPERIINLHLGLSPWYRGSATNLFPLIYKEPQCVGATVHFASENVDAGAILHQLRPEISEADDLHSLGNKVIEKAGKVLPEVLKNIETGFIKPVGQNDQNGKLCKIKDLNPDKLRLAYRNIADGMLMAYLQKKSEIDIQFPIIENITE